MSYIGRGIATSGISGYSGYSGTSGISGYSGYSGSGISGYSGYSGLAGSVTITDDTTTDTSYYPVLSTSTNGSLSSGKVSSTKLYFNPSTGTVSSTTFNSLSDETLKSDIKELSDSIDIINKIRPVSFKWNDTGIKSYGVIAQELEKILPELIETNGDGIKSVGYQQLIALLIDVVKTQNLQIKEILKILK